MENDSAASELAVLIRVREAEIFGKPPRLAPLAPEALSEDARRITRELRVAASLPPEGPMTDFIATALRHPALYGLNLRYAIALMSEGALSARDRELAILRTGWLCRAPFEWGEHVAIGKRVAGLTSQEIERVTLGSAAPEWDDHERAVLRAVEELHADAMISDKTWAALAERLDDRQLIELPLLVSQYVGVAYLQNSLRTPLLPGNVGLAAR